MLTPLESFVVMAMGLFSFLYNVLLLEIVFFGVLLVGAYLDWKNNKRVPDLVPATLWMLACLSVFFNPFVFLALPIIFSLLFFITALFAWFDKEMFGWSDILAIPPLLAMLALNALNSNPWLILIPFLAYAVVNAYALITKKEVPFYPAMVLVYFVSIILST